MYTFPLKFKAGVFPADEPLTILDSKKNELLFRPNITEPMKDGKTPCTIFSNKTASQALYTAQHQKKGEVESDVIKTASGTLLGTLTAESEHAWKVLDEHDNQLGTIQEKSTWKNTLLFEIVTTPLNSNDRDTFLKALSPHRYIVNIEGKKVMELREDVSAIRDDYSLKKSGELSDQVETLLVVSLMLTLSTK